ncbi:TetR/AcrR family transcriptional regulator [Nocardia seriolae]|uniref:Transcriptional regulator n=1 Tax=Nocardia seriolae TaxID=37332 RepID=A0A0B8MZD6_9NOCA|nr:TetR/AcrR family transcriptional regulator [Nocardia seriolae]MTJ60044.1 TetR family transcriptional regulator [Nocardia seriolae]MTJ70114.1 TetR family transcriptional regulator [Nocardia seriolae]MTJ85046.1 TetR family transcriptional regulator [Nocardia seriolae]MTK29041.1 TetR family transcriptional regulator [Nocardia seriolae]MTK37974.1 TetR family transcriptional regulator [Nocardia seriolae]
MTTRNPAGTRDRILDALETLLLDKGLSQVTLENVAAAAGVSKGGLLYHFKSKDALLAGLLRRVGERADEQVRTAVEQGRSVAEWYLQTPHPEDETDAVELALYRSMLAAMRTIDAPPDTTQAETDRALTEVLQSWKTALDNEIDDPVRAEIVRLVGDGVYLRALLGAPPVEPELYRRVVARLLETDTPRD